MPLARLGTSLAHEVFWRHVKMIMMTDELLDVIDQNNQVVNQEMKSLVHEKGLGHRVSAVLIQNQEGKYLITTASQHKVEAGNLFHSAAGHLSAGESYLQGAIRELEEELGLQSKEADLDFLGSFWFEKEYPSRKEKERFEVYKITFSVEMGQVRLNDEHLNEQWFSKEQLKEIYQDTPARLSAPLKHSCENIFKFSP